ncbi:MAG: hypothetical protein HRT72_07650, partial [Flavobacteriales bacterium]|nr:hypothetical protein [Flavobacteriales bacterium]
MSDFNFSISNIPVQISNKLILTIVLLLSVSVLFAQPSNDDICNAISLTDGQPLCGQDNTGATVAGGDVLGTCWEDAPLSGMGAVLSNTVWYSMVCPPSGGIFLTTDFEVAGGLLDTEMAIYSSSNGTCTGNLTEEDCNEDPSMTDLFTGHARIRVEGLNPGETYFIMLDGRSTSGVVYDPAESDEDYGTSTTGEFCIVGVEFGGGSGGIAGTTLDYFCNPDFSEYDAEGTDLNQDCYNDMGGTPGFFDQQNFPNCTDPVDVYNFDLDCGFQFNDVANNDFLGCEYTITMHWKFDQQNSAKDWQRLIDWSNHSSDDGMYVEGMGGAGGTYEFWEIQGMNGAGIGLDDEWNTGVFTRTCDDEFCMYNFDENGVGWDGSAEGLVLCIDDNGTGLVQSGDFINFFTDDDQVSNETAPGQIAYLSISNFANTQAEIIEMVPTIPCPCQFSPPPTCEVTYQVNETCFGYGNSMLEVTIAGDDVEIPYTVIWPTGNQETGLSNGSVAIENAVPSGFNVVTVTDNQGLEGTCSAYISVPPPVVIDTIVTYVNCNGESNGALDLTVTGGVGALSLIWDDNTTTEDKTGLSAGTYTVSVTDALGCIRTMEKTLIDPPPIVLTLVPTNEFSCGAPGSQDGSIDLTVTGGTLYPDTITTPGIGAGGTIVGKTSTSFFMDLTGVVNPGPITASTIKEVCVNMDDVPNGKLDKLELKLISPCGEPASILLKGNTNMNNAAAFNVCFTPDAGAQIGGADFSGIFLPEGEALDDPAGAIMACGNKEGAWELWIGTGEMNDGNLVDWTLTLEDTQPDTDLDLLWSTNETTEDISGLTGNNGFITYTVTATDDNGCTNSGSADIWCPIAPICSIAIDQEPSCFGFNDGMATVTVDLGSSPDFSIDWGNG